MKFKKGDRVKLTPAMAGVMEKGLAPRLNRKKYKPGWFTREGTIIRTPRFSGEVWVQWDDRKSADWWPIKALERVDGNTDSY